MFCSVLKPDCKTKKLLLLFIKVIEFTLEKIEVNYYIIKDPNEMFFWLNVMSCVRQLEK